MRIKIPKQVEPERIEIPIQLNMDNQEEVDKFIETIIPEERTIEEIIETEKAKTELSAEDLLELPLKELRAEYKRRGGTRSVEAMNKKPKLVELILELKS